MYLEFLILACTIYILTPHISKREKDDSPIDIVVIYTNLSDTEEIEKLANRLECEQFVRMAVVTGR